MPTTSGKTYLFDNATDEATRQVQLLAEILDPHSEQVLLWCEPHDGWRCLDLGSGGGTIATYLAEEVGPSGNVEALDKDPRHIPARDNITIRDEDVATAQLGEGVYDLVHARLLFMWAPERENLLRRAVTALKPGGLLVVSDWDCTRLDDMLVEASEQVRAAFAAFQTTLINLGVAVGMDPAWARRLPIALRDAGLQSVEGQVYNRLWYGGEPGMLLHACNSRQLEAPLLTAGMTSEQLEVLRAAMNDPAVAGWTYPMVTAVGRRPR